ncbi:hypothetical protein LINPERHAP2_LOCUS36913 [Linum perenne]
MVNYSICFSMSHDSWSSLPECLTSALLISPISCSSSPTSCSSVTKTDLPPPSPIIGHKFRRMKKDYSQLPEEIVEKIATEHLDTFSQVVAFSGVCTSWRSAALDLYNRRHHVPSLPGILVSEASRKRPHCDIHHRHKYTDPAPNSRRRPHHQFLPISTIFDGVDSVVNPPSRWSPPDFLTRRRMNLRLQTLEEEAEEELGLESTPNSAIAVDLQKCHCIASRDGWLVLSDYPWHPRPTMKIFIVNPVTRASIVLPPLLYDQFKYLDRGYTVLSSSPDDDDCYIIIITIYCGTPQVAWCKVNGGLWKFTPKDFRIGLLPECHAYFGDKLYLVDSDNYLHIISNLINSTEAAPPTVKSFLFSSAMECPYNTDEECEQWSFHHVLELKGEPVVILRYCYKDSVTVKVYKLVLLVPASSLSCSDYCWEEVKSLDGYAVFLGTHQSMCVALKNIDNKMVKGNHIYYLNFSCSHCDFFDEHYDTEPWWYYSRDCGVYSLEHRKLVERSRGRDRYRDYVWFSPMPWDIRKHIEEKQGQKVSEQPSVGNNNITAVLKEQIPSSIIGQ